MTKSFKKGDLVRINMETIQELHGKLGIVIKVLPDNDWLDYKVAIQGCPFSPQDLSFWRLCEVNDD